MGIAILLKHRRSPSSPGWTPTTGMEAFVGKAWRASTGVSMPVPFCWLWHDHAIFLNHVFDHGTCVICQLNYTHRMFMTFATWFLSIRVLRSRWASLSLSDSLHLQKSEVVSSDFGPWDSGMIQESTLFWHQFVWAWSTDSTTDGLWTQCDGALKEHRCWG